MYEIAGELERRRSGQFDAELLLCAGLLHDAGLYPAAASGEAYVTDGRRLAERVLEPFAWDLHDAAIAPRLKCARTADDARRRANRARS